MRLRPSCIQATICTWTLAKLNMNLVRFVLCTSVLSPVSFWHQLMDHKNCLLNYIIVMTLYNPRLTRLLSFCNTTNQGGGCCNPPWTWNINSWGLLTRYHTISVGFLFLTIPKKYKIFRVWRHNDVTIADFAQFGDFQWNKNQNWIFRRKYSKYQNFTGFFFGYKEGNDVSNIYCRIQDHTMKIFVKILISNIAGLHQTPSPSDFDGLPYPRVRWQPRLFSSKSPQRMSRRLLRCPRSLYSAFWSDWKKNPQGGCNNPLVWRGLIGRDE